MSRGTAAGLSRFVAVEALTHRRRALSGRVDLSKLSRLQDAASAPEGSLEADLQFGTDEQGHGRVSGTISVDVALECQRCLGTFRWTPRLDVDWTLVTSDAEESRLLKTCEPIRVDDDRLELFEALQDEVLLAVPMMPHCPEGQCSETN